MAERDVILIEGLRAEGVVGLREPERSAPQSIVIDAELSVDLGAMARSDDVRDGVNYKTVAQEMVAYAGIAARHTLESLASDLAGVCLFHGGVESASICVWKPAQDGYADRVAVRVTRTRAELMTRVFVVLGSNTEPETHLPAALEGLSRVGEVAGVSGVYETADVRNNGGSAYLNAAALLETCLPPGAVRGRLKAIERELGRERSTDPVTIDLDLCLYGDSVVRTGGVDVPRREILERGYVARTLADLDASFVHPETGETLGAIASRLGGDLGSRRREDLELTVVS